MAEPAANYNSLVNCGRITGVSGSNGAVLWQKHGASSYAELGKSVIAIGDSNGDGIGDLLLSQPMASTGSLTRNGVVELISGQTYINIWTAEGTRDGEMLGAASKVVNDVDGDGAMGNEVDDDGDGATGIEVDDDGDGATGDDNDDDDGDDGDRAMGSGATGYDDDDDDDGRRQRR